MEFTFEGHKFVLRGTSQVNMAPVDNKGMSKLLKGTSSIDSNQLYSVKVRMCLPSHDEVNSFGPTVQWNKMEAICPEFNSLLQKYQDIFEEPKSLSPHRTHDHRILVKEGAEPMNVKPYYYASVQKDIIKQLTRVMLASSIIQHSMSPFFSLVILVKRKDETWQFCVDCRELNKQTIKDKYPIPLIKELLDELQGSTIYSKIDLQAGYHQIRMHPDNMPKTAFKTHKGHYEYLVMPFSLTNALATFQSLMNEEQMEHLKAFQLLRANKLFAKTSKCSFGSRKVEYLGHYISAEGVAPNPNKVEAVKNWPIPQSVKAFKGFLGLTNYYRQFVKNHGGISKPLTNLLKKEAFTWNEQATHAFKSLKEAMTTAPVLALLDFSQEFVVETDACGWGIGVVLMQKGHPIAYISKSLSLKNQALSIYEKELLALIYVVNQWTHYLFERPFVVKTDHESLKYLLE
ncbi:hypothetical protein SLEP1_g26098 [Rubroshorea leprosula]|uniref:Reverse transcriptase/retrotransposon-derived protein RNase H-like domain-containing protein n=1 Tax=Rubroshorea leprosula TaxID=152421 RepID=A0AAV5JUP5_9ROSI|nr:hypothetical protein SLEP1_g26098 [Rubroshorea leprosula]